MNEWWTTLPTTLDQVWQRLSRGVADWRAFASHPTLATTGDAGSEARIIVLRQADRTLGMMAVHIDLRSAKVTELLAEPRATLLIWEQKARLQIRLRVQVEVKSGQTVTADWQCVP